MRFEAGEYYEVWTGIKAKLDDDFVTEKRKGGYGSAGA